MSPGIQQPHLDRAGEQVIHRIRVELLSTEMPVHQLSKRGNEEIRIVRRNPRGGQISLLWKVEPNLKVGRPGQLAYHLDTWVINRRLDDLPRPIPRLIRIGNLREIARELDHGGDTNAIRRAFEQNASAFIRAKIAHKAPSGESRTFEGYFNRYNVFFRGQTLPGGLQAETAYISLNDPYYSLINQPERRPLDFAYLRSLGPAAQRFYELLSPKMFAAIKNAHPIAWMRYSEFCQLAVQRRYTTRRMMQIQMAAIHRPHLSSTYLAGVAYRTAPSTDGRLDWIIQYTPGARARSEFAAFNGPLTQTATSSVLQGSSGRAAPAFATTASTAVAADRNPGLDVHGSPLPQSEEARSLVVRFAESRFGAGGKATAAQIRRAQEIIDALGGDLDAARIAVDVAAEEGRNDKRGFPKHLGGVLEGGYVAKARALYQEEQRQRSALAERARHEESRATYKAWCNDRATKRIAELTPEARYQLVDERLQRFVEEYEFYIRLRSWSGERVRVWAEPRILEEYGREGELPFEAWCRLHDPETTSSSGPNEALQ